MSVELCPATDCFAEMELGEDADGKFFHCRECGMDWDYDDIMEDDEANA